MKDKVCGLCENTDGLCYMTDPPQYKCKVTGQFHKFDDDCNVETTKDAFGCNSKMLTWHSVKDDAPPTDEEVLVCFCDEQSGEYGSCVVAYYTNDDETLEEFECPVWWTTDRNYIVDNTDKWAHIEKPEVPNV